MTEKLASLVEARADLAAARGWHGACLSSPPMSGHAPRRSRPYARGFTLVELLIVVAMIGVLAALAIVGYRKYLTSAQTGEARIVMQSIRNGEHVYKTDMLTYLSCASSYKDYYPQGAGGPNDRKWAWINPGHPQVGCYAQLNVDTDGAVRFGYAVVAGGGSDTVPAMDSTDWKDPPVWPDPDAPWYVVQATGDRDVDGKLAVLVSSSFDNKIYVENEDE